MTIYKGSGAQYLTQLLQGVTILAEFSHYAESIGCQCIQGDVVCDARQAALLDAWWARRTTPTPATTPACGAVRDGASWWNCDTCAMRWPTNEPWNRRCKHPESKPTPERCNCDASCGENRYHDKYREGCRYHCEYCDEGWPITSQNGLNVHYQTTVHRGRVVSKLVPKNAPLCHRRHG